MAKFQAGQKKLPNAGRRAGTPNKNRAAVLELVRLHGKDPVLVLSELTIGPDLEKAHWAASQLMPYCYPKLQSTQISNDPENPIGQTNDKLKQELIDVIRKAKEERSKK